MARKFSNLNPRHRPHGLRNVLRWGVRDLLSGRRKIQPAGPPAPREAADLGRVRDTAGTPRLTWIGHASFLGSLAGGTFLVDPVFSARVGWVVRRRVSPGLLPPELPALDAILVTHCHYDHLDKHSLRALPAEVPAFVPLGLGRWLRRWGLSRVTELDWWESATAGPLRFTLVPARHWSRRWVHDTNRTLWGGFVIEAREPAADGQGAFYHAGDSGFFDGFREIGRRFPGLLAAMLPIGCYTPHWFMERHHMNPEQAGRAFLELGARHLVAMHWGTFKLGDECLAEPAERLHAWWREHAPDGGRQLHVPPIGRTIVFGPRGA